MTVNSAAAEALFCAGWIAVGAAAAYSRYKRALELGDEARGVKVEGAARETHRGLYFGRSEITAEPAPEWKAPEMPEAPVSLVSLAKALADAQQEAQPKEEKTPAP